MSDPHSADLISIRRLQVVSSPQSGCEAPGVLRFLCAGCILRTCRGGLASCCAAGV